MRERQFMILLKEWNLDVSDDELVVLQNILEEVIIAKTEKSATIDWRLRNQKILCDLAKNQECRICDLFTINPVHEERPYISLKTRFAVFKRDNFRCVYCGASPKDGETKLELDHIKPFSGEGSDDIDNLVASCFECNRGKGNDEL